MPNFPYLPEWPEEPTEQLIKQLAKEFITDRLAADKNLMTRAWDLGVGNFLLREGITGNKAIVYQDKIMEEINNHYQGQLEL